MAFHFPLQAVFHLRQSMEHQQELRLRSANQQVARVRHLMEQFDAHLHDRHLQRLRDLVEGVTAAELRFASDGDSCLLDHRKALEGELVRLQNLRDQQQRIYEQARRDRETFESLHDHQFSEYQRDVLRRAQRELDDTFLLRSSYKKKSTAA
jgi:flagellar export protein FliJ